MIDLVKIRTPLPLPLPQSLDALDLDWAGIEGRFGKVVRQCFIDAAMDAVVDAVRQHLMLQPATQQDIAEKVNVGRTSITHFLRGGGISLRHFLHLTTEYGMRVDELCPETERAVAGFLAAMPLVRQTVFGRTDPAVRLDREALWSLCYLWASRDWREAVAIRDRAEKCVAADHIRRRLRNEVGIEVSPDFGVTRLENVMADWGASWIVCLRLVPCRWAF
jgi:hypothetical protein